MPSFSASDQQPHPAIFGKNSLHSLHRIEPRPLHLESFRGEAKARLQGPGEHARQRGNDQHGQREAEESKDADLRPFADAFAAHV